MGSSSSFTVGILNAFSSYRNKEISKKELANKSIFFEQKILKETVGIQDQIAASYGGFNSVKFFRNGNFTVNPVIKNKSDLRTLNKNLFLVYTKIKRTANYIAKTYVKKLTTEKKDSMDLILGAVKECKAILRKKNFDEIGPLLNKSWIAKKRLSNVVTNKFLNELYELIYDIPGVIMEFGCWWGQNLCVFENLRAIYEPFNQNRKIIGFDTFSGYTQLSSKDISGGTVKESGHRLPEGYENYLEDLLSCHEKINLLGHIKKHSIIKGDVTQTLPDYLKNQEE